MTKIFDKRALESLKVGRKEAIAHDAASRLPKHPALRAPSRSFALVTREDRLEWLRAMANGEIYEQRVHVSKFGEITEYAVPAGLELRKRCVELMCEIEGDLRERTNVNVNQTNVQYILRDNGRAALPPAGYVEAEGESTDVSMADASGQPTDI